MTISKAGTEKFSFSATSTFILAQAEIDNKAINEYLKADSTFTSAVPETGFNTDSSNFDIRKYETYLQKNPVDSNKYICPNCEKNDLSINKETGAYSCYSGCNDSKAIRKACHELRGEKNNPPLLQTSRETTQVRLNRLQDKAILTPSEHKGDVSAKSGIKYNCTETRYDYGLGRQIVRRDFYSDRKESVKNKDFWTEPSKDNNEKPSNWKPYKYETLKGAESVLWVEGESCADFARVYLGIVTITSRPGSDKVLFETLQEQGVKYLVVFPDSDAPGLNKAKSLEKSARNTGIKVIILLPQEIWSEMPEKGDVKDWIQYQLEKGIFDLNSSISLLEKLSNKELNKTEEKKESVEDIKAKAEGYEVTTTPEETVLKTLFLNEDKWTVLGGNFYKYSNKSVWEHVSDVEVERLVAEHLRLFWAIKKIGDEYIPAYIFAGQNNLKNSVKFVRSILSKEVPQEYNNHLIAFSNGVLDTKKRELLPHDDSYLLTFGFEGDYEPTDKCPETILTWLIETFGEESLELIRAIISMYLDPLAPFGYFVHFIGQSGGGKGTMISLIESLFPPTNVSSHGTFSEISSPEKRHQHLGQSRLAFFEDIGGYQTNVRDFYKLVDNHPLAGRQLNNATGYSKRWNTRFIVASVLSLQIENAGDGWKRRCIPIHLKRRDTKKIDPKLKSKLIEHKTGLMMWALSMPKEERDNLITTARWQHFMSEAKTEESRNSSGVLQFIDSCLVPSDLESDIITNTKLYKYYKAYCEEAGLKSLGLNLFSQQMKDAIYNHFKERKQTRINGQRQNNPPHFYHIELASKNIFKPTGMNGDENYVCQLESCREGGMVEFESFMFPTKKAENDFKEQNKIDEEDREIKEFVKEPKENAAESTKTIDELGNTEGIKELIELDVRTVAKQFLQNDFSCTNEELIEKANSLIDLIRSNNSFNSYLEHHDSELFALNKAKVSNDESSDFWRELNAENNYKEMVNEIFSEIEAE